MRKVTLLLLACLLASPAIHPLTAPVGAQGVPGPRIPTSCGETVFGLTAGGMLISFNSDSPDRIDAARPITGLQPGESLLGIDYRPAVQEIYGISNQNRLYIIDAQTGVARLTATLTVGVNGTAFGVDFNPVPDRLRVVSNAGQNLRINVSDGVVAVDGMLAYNTGDANAGQVPNLVGSAYANNFAGATATTLYGIDAGRDILVIQNPPNDGRLNTVGALGVNTTEQVGFDIAAGSTRAFATLTPAGGTSSSLYTVNLRTGAATLVGQIGAGVPVRGITVAPRDPRLIYALTTRNRILVYSEDDLSTVVDVLRVRGLQRGESLLALDFRPANGRLYALGSSSTVYTINLRNGAATRRPVAPFSTALTGTAFGFDFNPTVDRIRVTGNTTQNLRLNPDTGDIAAVDGALAYAAGDPGAGTTPVVVGSAYTNNFATATTTVLYNIDAARDTLVTQNPPNNGTLNTVGALGVNASSLTGFDIFGCDNEGFAVLTLEGETEAKLYKINLATGAARLVGTLNTTDAFGRTETIVGIAVR